MKLVIRVCLAVVGIALIAVGSGGLAMSAITAKPAQADNAGGYSMEVRIAASQVALTDPFEIGVGIYDIPAPYQSAQWNIDYDQTLIDIDSIAEIVKDPLAPAECTSKNDNGTRFLVGCVGLSGPTLTYSGNAWTITAFCIAAGTANFTLTLVSTNVSDGTSAQTIHTHNDSIECGGAGPTDTPVPVVASATIHPRNTNTRTPKTATPTPSVTPAAVVETPAPAGGSPAAAAPTLAGAGVGRTGIAPPDTGSGDGTRRGATPFAAVYGALIALGGIALASGLVFGRRAN